MKYTALLLAVWVIQSCSVIQLENDRTRENLRGKVKSFSELSYEAIVRSGHVEKGRCKRKMEYDYDIFIKYDENGNIIVQKWYNSNDSLLGKLIYTYDHRGNKIEKNAYSSDGSLYNKYIYAYNQMGNQIEEKLYNSKGILTNKNTYTYDDKANLTEHTEYGSAGFYVKNTYAYDEQGNQIEQNRYNADGSLEKKYSRAYEYDTQGNWTKKLSFKNKIPEYIQVREYEYYK